MLFAWLVASFVKLPRTTSVYPVLARPFSKVKHFVSVVPSTPSLSLPLAAYALASTTTLFVTNSTIDAFMKSLCFALAIIDAFSVAMSLEGFAVQTRRPHLD